MLQRNTQLFMEQVGKIIRIIIKPVCDFGDRYFHACIYPDPLKDFLQTLVVFSDGDRGKTICGLGG